MREAAASALQQLGVQTVLKYLEHQDQDVREAAAIGLGQLGEHAVPGVPAITEYLEHSDEGVRKAAVSALGNLGAHAVSCVPVVVKYLEHEREDVSEAAASALGKLGEHAVGGVPAVTEYLDHNDQCVREAAASALGQLGVHAALGMPAITKHFLREEDIEKPAMDRVDALDTSLDAHRVGKRLAIVPGMAALTHGMSVSSCAKYLAQEAAESALRQIGVPTLVVFLGHKDQDVREAAASGLGQLGEDAVSAVPAVVQLLEHLERHMREIAVMALGQLGNHAASGLEAVTKYLQAPQPNGLACNRRREKQCVRHHLEARHCKTQILQFWEWLQYCEY